MRRIQAPFPGRLAVIGGQCRKVGKSSLVVDLIQTFPDWHWTAVKVTPYTDAGCPVDGANCGCGPNQHTFAIREEEDRNGSTDTGRYLQAGAERAIWVQSKKWLLPDALPDLATVLAKAETVIIESNAIVGYWQPDLFLMVLDPRKADFKASARRALAVADAFVLRSPPRAQSEAIEGIATRNGKRKFLQPLGYALPGSMQTFVRQHFRGLRHLRGGDRGSLFS